MFLFCVLSLNSVAEKARVLSAAVSQFAQRKPASNGNAEPCDARYKVRTYHILRIILVYTNRRDRNQRMY